MFFYVAQVGHRIGLPGLTASCGFGTDKEKGGGVKLPLPKPSLHFDHNGLLYRVKFDDRICHTLKYKYPITRIIIAHQKESHVLIIYLFF